MRIIQNIDKKEKDSLLEELYKSFETGFAFEDFLKPFLESIGLTEVVVTKKTGDGGIDFVLRIDVGTDPLASVKIVVRNYSAPSGDCHRELIFQAVSSKGLDIPLVS